MKKWIFVLIAVLVAFNWSKLEPTFNKVLRKEPIPTSFSGFYEQDRSKNPENPLGLNFLDETNVEMFSGNRKLGATVHYRIKGDSLDVIHSCGVWHMKIRENKLYHEELESDFIKKE